MLRRLDTRMKQPIDLPLQPTSNSMLNRPSKSFRRLMTSSGRSARDLRGMHGVRTDKSRRVVRSAHQGDRTDEQAQTGSG